MAKKEGFNALFDTSTKSVSIDRMVSETKLVKLHCMIDSDVKKALDIYAINNSMKIKDVVADAIKKHIGVKTS